MGRFLARVAGSEDPVALADAALAPPEETAGQQCSGLRSLLGLRLWPHGRLLGVVYVGSRHLRPYEPQARRYLETLVEYLSGILDRALLFQKLHEATRLHAQGETHWRQLVESMQSYATLCLLDPEGRVATWDAGAERLTGYGADQVLGQHLRLFYPEGARHDADAHLREAARSGRFSGEGWRVRAKEPSPFWAEMTLLARRDAGGALLGFTKITRDLTERQSAEAERARLLERERRRGAQLRELAEVAVALHAAEGVPAVLQLITDRARSVIGAHQSVTSLSARTGHEIRAISLSEQYRAWKDYSEPPDGSGIYALVLEQGRPLRLTQAELEAHPRFRHFGGREEAHPPLRGWLAVPLLDHAGQPFGLIQLSDREEGDFTPDDEAMLVQLAQLASVAVENAQLLRRLRESEDRLRLSLAAAELGTWDYDPLGGALSWDERTRALFGLPPDATVTRDTFFSVVHPEDRERTREQVRRALAGEGGGLYDAEYRVAEPPEGRERWVSAHGRAFFDAEGRPRRFLGTVRDVTEHKRWDEEAARRLQFEEQLIGIVSHDLRNPLNAILLSTGALLRRADLDAQAREGLLRTLGSAERMVRLIRDLLDFTQARLGGGLPLRRGPLDLHALAQQVVDEVRLAHPERVLQLAQEGEGHGVGDADRLAQVLTNLVTNALQYSPADAPVQVRTRGSAGGEGGPGELTLTVHNAGEPIDPSLLPRLFQPLERGPGAGRASGGARRSIGLGLYIVEHIVRAHGGRIEVDSRAGAGTTFTVRLPREPPTAAPRTAPAAAPP
nr:MULTISPECIES: PAS domain S-box protein [Myxococcaceae]